MIIYAKKPGISFECCQNIKNTKEHDLIFEIIILNLKKPTSTYYFYRFLFYDKH